MCEMKEPEWMRKIFDREDEPRVIGENITVIMALLKVARAAEELHECLDYDEDAEVWTYEEKNDEDHKLWVALKELPEGILLENER